MQYNKSQMVLHEVSVLTCSVSSLKRWEELCANCPPVCVLIVSGFPSCPCLKGRNTQGPAQIMPPFITKSCFYKIISM